MKLKQISKRTLSIVLTVLMVFSTLFVGTISVNAANKITGYIYFDNTLTDWSSVYCYIGHDNYLKSFKMIHIGEGIWKTETSLSNDWGDQTGVRFGLSDGGLTGGSNKYNINSAFNSSGLNLSSYTAKSTDYPQGTTGENYCYVPASSSNDATITRKTVAAAKAAHISTTGTQITSTNVTNLLSVLNGTNVMFYYGDQWDSGWKYLYSSDGKTEKAYVNTSAQETTNNTYYGSACLPAAKYNVTNTSSWHEMVMSSDASAGALYSLNSSGGNNIKVVANKNVSSFSTTSYTITKGTAASGVSATKTNTTSVVGSTTELQYYYTQNDTDYYYFNPDDASTLDVGTYKIIPVVYDGSIYVKGSNTATLNVTSANVSNITASAKYTTDGTTYTATATPGVTISKTTDVGSDGTTVTAPESYTESGATYKFAGWTTETADTGSFTDATALSTTFKPSADNAVAVAQYKKVYSITVNPLTNGSVAANKTPAEYLAGDSYTLTVTPVSQFKLQTLTVGGTDVTTSVSNKQYTGTITSDLTVEATFEESKDIVIYVACPTNWGTGDQAGTWDGMCVTNALNGNAAANDNNVYGLGASITANQAGCSFIGNKNVDGTERKVSVVTLPGEASEWTEFYLGNKAGDWFSSAAKFTGSPKYGYCYYFYASGDNTYTGTCAATTISSPKVNSATTASIKPGDSVTFNATVTKNNTASGSYTAGGTTYGVQYTLTNVNDSSDVHVFNTFNKGGGGTEIKGRGVVEQTYTTSDSVNTSNLNGTYTVTAQIFDDYTMIDSTGTSASLTVTPETPTYTGSITGNGKGAVTVKTAAGVEVAEDAEVTAGTEYLITVTPATGSGISSVTVNEKTPQELPSNAIVSTTAKTYTYTMSDTDTGLAVAAEFELIDYTITTTGDTNCTVSANATANYNSEVTFNISVTNDAYKVDTVKITDESGTDISTAVTLNYTAGATSGTFTMPDKNVNVVVTTVAKPTYAVTCSTVENGTVTADLAKAYEGQQVTVTATPGSGYVLDAVTVTGTSGASVAITDGKFTMPNEAITVTATFKAPSFKILGLDGKWYKDADGYTSLQTYDNASGPVLTQLEGMSGIYYAHLNNTTSNSQYFRIVSNENVEKNEFVSSHGYKKVSEYSSTSKDTVVACSTSDDAWEITKGEDLYIVFDYNNKKLWPQTTEPKLSDFVPSFSVTMTMGENGYVKGEDRRADSGFDGTVYTSDHTETYSKEDHLTVAFRSETTHKGTVDETEYIKYAVQGYSILMTLDNNGEDVIRVASVTSVYNPSAGVYTATYTFPENIKSAVVTPVFTLTDEYAAAMKITFTTVYLMYTPNNPVSGFQCYEPYYMTWRGNGYDYTMTTSDKRVLEYFPDSEWPGQKMLYLGNNMYAVKVQSDIQGILFDDNDYDKGGTITQTFDYDEFIRLQKLGYDHITFELRNSNDSPITAALDSAYNKNYYKIYDTPQDVSSALTSTVYTDANINQEFAILSDIEGDVIDVFGNKLKDTSGNAIAYKSLAVQADGSEGTTLQKLEDLLIKMGTLSSGQTLADLPSDTASYLFGARYGDGAVNSGYPAPLLNDIGYGMQYPVRVYYFDNLKNMPAQMVSGYGNIENSASTTAGQTNIEAGLANYDYWTTDQAPVWSDDSKTYTSGSWNTATFSTDNTVIPTSYANMPYLVSYSVTKNNRVDGKWYYQRGTAQLEVTVETAILNADGSYSRNTNCGTATVNGAATAQVDQGSNPTFVAENNAGYAFVGWYNASGERYDTAPTYSGHTVASEETIYAVFKQLEEFTLTVTNYIYQGEGLTPAPGGGSGTVTATLYVSPYDELTKTYGDYVAYTSGSATVRDGDKVYWVLTGTATGIDEFIAFRAKEENGDVVNYTELNTVENLVINNRNSSGKATSATYTSNEMVWNWSDYGTSYTIVRYTDFQRVDKKATLYYHYQDRFGNEKIYVVKDVLLDATEVAKGNYKPSVTQVEKNAPYVGDLYKNITWICADQEVNTYGTNTYGNSVAHIYGKGDPQSYIAFMGSYSTDGSVDLSAYDSTINLHPVNTSVTLKANPTSDGKNFSYWMIYQISSDGTKTLDNGEIFSYNKDITFRSTFNAVYIPVYGKTVTPFTTNVQQAVYSREQSTEGDYVYADFLTQFETSVPGVLFKDAVANTSTGKTLTVGDKTITSIKFGLLTERDMNAAAYSGGTITAPSANSVQNIKDNVVNLYTTGQTSGWDKNSASGTAAYNYYYNLYDYTASAANLTEYGRMDFFFKFENTAENQGKVYNVYSYVYYTYSDGTTEVVLGTPSVLNIYAAGTKTLNSTSA